MDPKTLAAIRILLLVGGTWLTNHGYADAKDITALTDPSVLEALIGLAVTGGTAVWGILSRRKPAILKDASKVLRGKGVIIAPKEIADKLPKNVVPSIEAAEQIVPHLRTASAASASH